MAQRDLPRRISGSPPIDTARDEQAFQRIHLDSWSQLKWYVEFGESDLRALTPKKLGETLDDITTIQRAFYGHVFREVLGLEQLLEHF